MRIGGLGEQELVERGLEFLALGGVEPGDEVASRVVFGVGVRGAGTRPAR